MPNVTTSYGLYLGRRERRRRRATGQAGFVDLLRAETNTVSGTYRPAAPSELPHGSGGGASVLCPFLFWSVRNAGDGTYTSADQYPHVRIGATDATVTAWYRRPGGKGSGGVPFVEVDVFSLHLDDFVDETSIVRSEPPSAQGQGDDDNLLFTADSAVTADLAGNLASDPQSGFDSWVALLPGRTEGARLFDQRGADGFTIASYCRPVPVAPKRVVFREGYQLIGQITVDGGGWLIGPDGRPIPVGPWDRAVVKAVAASGAPLVQAPPWDSGTIAKLQETVANDALTALSKEVLAGNVAVSEEPDVPDIGWKG